VEVRDARRLDAVLITTVPLWEIVLRTALVYLAVLVLLRLAGKREMGHMSLADFVVILVIANAVQNALNGADPSLTGGLVSAATLVLMSYLLDRYGRRAPILGRLLSGEPTLLLQDGRLLEQNLRREHLEAEDVQMAAREHGVADLSDVAAAVLEGDGSISIIPKRGEMHRSPRRADRSRRWPTTRSTLHTR
jgi:uncharacterized membrane protein YcaP (DUF421 family)